MEEPRDVAIAGLFLLSALRELFGRLGSSASVGMAAQYAFSPGQDRHRAVGRLPFRSFSIVLTRRPQRTLHCALLAAATTLPDELYLRPAVRNGHFGVVTVERKVINEPRRPVSILLVRPLVPIAVVTVR